MLEAEDRLDTVRRENDATDYEVKLDLRPRDVRREVFGRVVEEKAEDEDEIILTEARGDIEVTASDVPVLHALGVEAQLRQSRKIVLSAGDGASRLRPSDEVSCRPTFRTFDGRVIGNAGDRRPYLRIWYVAPAETRNEAEVDPAVRERLRSLGYDW
jgi:hypothetical protein